MLSFWVGGCPREREAVTFGTLQHEPVRPYRPDKRPVTTTTPADTKTSSLAGANVPSHILLGTNDITRRLPKIKTHASLQRPQTPEHERPNAV
jgi:hypothetical protein